jgi:hypothetical protein
MGHTHISDRHGNHQRRTVARSTEAVSSPVDQVLAARRAGFAAQADVNQHLTFRGAADNIPNPTTRAAGFDLNSRNPTLTRRTDPSGKHSKPD